MEAVTHRIRQVLAILLVGLLPGAIYFWGELYVSGYTRNPDGSRDIGHMEKLLSPASITDMLLLLSTMTISTGLIALAVTRVTGRLTAVRLVVVAAGLGALIPLMFAVPAAFAGSLPWWMLPVPAVSAAAGAVVLSGLFSLIAGLPLPAYRQAQMPASDPQRAPMIVVGVAAVATILVLAWFTYLYAWALAHPCPGCFG